MKRILSPKSRGPLILYRFMVLLVLVLIVFLIAGTIYSFFRSPGSSPLFRLGSSGAGQADSAVSAGDAVNVFTGIGRLRIPLAGGAAGSGGTLILSIAFPYPPGDRAFTEELASRIGDFRAIAIEYFSSLPAEKLVNLDEDAAKAEILRRYNTSLRLGKIAALYFNDLMIVD
ncbi:flagellar basal body protein FliL [Spirochaetia bacterium]|nr:flagellar basal body protein FliL [Spirochaetia bacterium]